MRSDANFELSDLTSPSQLTLETGGLKALIAATVCLATKILRPSDNPAMMVSALIPLTIGSIIVFATLQKASDYNADFVPPLVNLVGNGAILAIANGVITALALKALSYSTFAMASVAVPFAISSVATGVVACAISHLVGLSVETLVSRITS